jgi:hypothetical protein
MIIRNERQYRATRAQAEKFARTLREWDGSGAANPAVHPVLRKAQVEALRSQLADLRRQLREFEGLRTGRRRVAPAGTLDDLPRRLVQGRIAAGLTQRELAARLGLKEQQIQRYEATGYASATLRRLRQVAGAIFSHTVRANRRARRTRVGT